MYVTEIIESRRYRHKASQRCASIYGASPWAGAPGNTRDDWEMETSGYTWRMSNGTVGLGRAPAATREEAEEIARKVNERSGRSFPL